MLLKVGFRGRNTFSVFFFNDAREAANEQAKAGEIGNEHISRC